MDIYETVVKMKEAHLPNGIFCETGGKITLGDNHWGRYFVESQTDHGGMPDEVSNFLLADLNVARLVTIDRTAQGVIAMWSGSAAVIPMGWGLCDGSNGTPDLRDKFIIGAGIHNTIGDTGGSRDSSPILHTHQGSATEAGEHFHEFGGALAAAGGTTNVGFRESSTGAVTELAGVHTHPLTINPTGIAGSGRNDPEYYTIAYIIRL